MFQNRIAYVLLRLGLAVSFFGHGLVRIDDLPGFSAGIVKQFADSPLPESAVHAFAYVLPIIEFLTGFFLLLGLFTRFFLIVGSITMIALVFGSCMIQNWEAINSQFIHLFFLVLLLGNSNMNTFALDHALVRSPVQKEE